MLAEDTEARSFVFRLSFPLVDGDGKSLRGCTGLQRRPLSWGRGASGSEPSSCWILSLAAAGELRWANERWGEA